MIHNIERVIAQMDDENIERLAEFTGKAAARRAEIREFAMRSLLDSGFEIVDVAGAVTSDGRTVLTVNGATVALKKEVHEARLREALDVARAAFVKKQQPVEQETPAQRVKEEISTITCPQMTEGRPCGGALNKKGVCPACISGQMGYRYRYSCESCGLDIVTKTELR